MMKTYKLVLMAMIAFAILFTPSCSKETLDGNPAEEVDKKLSLKVYQISDFYIETSWLSGESSTSTSSFSSTGTDNESWYDKNSSGYYTMKSLKTDGNRTEWKEINESSLYSGKSMEYMAKIESIPENGVTIAQIHNRGNNVERPWLRVYIDDDRKIKVKVTTGGVTSSSGTYAPVTVGNTYTQGTNLKVKISYTGGQASIEVTKEDGTILLDDDYTPSSAWNSFSSDYYFKAGVYTEGDDKQPKITFYYFYFND